MRGRLKLLALGAVCLTVLVAQQGQPPAARGAQGGRGQGGGRGGRGRPAGRKVVLAWADTRNGIAQHDSVSHALALIERLGYESGLWDTYIRTDSNIASYQPQMTTGQPASGGPSFNNVDAIFFMGHREVPIDEKQKAELLKFVHDDGKGFVAAHVGLTALMSWPEFGEMLGGQFPRTVNGSKVEGSVINEDPNFPATRHLPAIFSTDGRVLSGERTFRARRAAYSCGSTHPSFRPIQESDQQGRRFSARMGEDVRQRPRVLWLIRARREDLGQSRRLSHVLRGDPLGPRIDRCGCNAADAFPGAAAAAGH